MNRRSLLQLLGSLVAAALLFLSPTPAPAAPSPMDEVRVGIGDEPFSLDPNLANTVADSKCLSALGEGLVRLDGDANPHPAVAESWEHNPDYTVWTFHLRKEAKWSDGAPVTSQDFLYSLRRILNPKLEAQYAQTVMNFIKGGKEFYEGDAKDPSLLKVAAPDPQTLVITCANPTPWFDRVVNHTSWFPVQQKAVEKDPTGWANKPETWVGNGAFVLSEFRTHDRIVVTANPNYWDKASIHWKRIVFRPIPDQQTELAAFENGEVDFTDRMLITEVGELKKRPEYAPPKAYLGCYGVLFQVKDPPFNDPALRKAFSLAINRKVVVERITKRDEPMSEGLVPRGITGVDGKDFRDVSGKLVDNASYKANVAKAKKILADAGYAVDGKPGKPIPRIEYLMNTSTDHKLIGEALQNMWKAALGVDVSIATVEFKVKVDRGHRHEFQFQRWGWIADYYDPMTFLSLFRTGDGNNDAAYSNPKYDELLAQAEKEQDATKRWNLLAAAEKILVEDDCVIAPVFDYREPILVRTNVKGWVRNQLADLDVTRAWREEEKK